jgi:arsenate reductase
MSVKIYHNPRCSKSRQTLQLLVDNGVQAEVIEYLKTPPTTEELDAYKTRILTIFS